MTGNPNDRCPDDLLSNTVAQFEGDQKIALSKVEALLNTYPNDARLLFLRGSLLAGLEQYADARRAMQAAVQAAPDYALARFQLGFLELTSGEAATAVDTWGPLKSLPIDNFLRLFAAGLEHLINDRYPETIDLLRRGIAQNTAVAPLNSDMQLIIDKTEALTAGDGKPDEALSATQLLLQRYGGKSPTKH